MRRRRRWRQTGSTSVFAAGLPNAQGEGATTAVERRLMPLAYIFDTLWTRSSSSAIVSHSQTVSRASHLVHAEYAVGYRIRYLLQHPEFVFQSLVAVGAPVTKTGHREVLDLCLARLGGYNLQQQRGGPKSFQYNTFYSTVQPSSPPSDPPSIAR